MLQRQKIKISFTNFRPSSRQTDQYPPDNYTSFLNTNNSTAFHSGSYHPLYQQQQWHEAVEQSLRGSLPQSRGGPVGYETSLSYHHQPPQGNISNQFLQHRQHVYPQQVHEDLTLTHFQDQYSRNDGNGAPVTYHTYEHRPQQFYTGPSHAYRPTPDQYSHHRGNAYVDSSSTKVWELPLQALGSIAHQNIGPEYRSQKLGSDYSSFHSIHECLSKM